MLKILQRPVHGLIFPIILLLMTACGGPRTTTQAELPFKKLMANAETETRAGNYGLAADNYRKAYEQKPRRTDVLYKAAELYTRVRNYRAAADAYQFLEADEDQWPLLGLQYGRALKQDGRYDQARRELALFLETYNGADRPIVSEIVRNELAGITLATSFNEAESMVDIDRPGRGVNTGADEFGAVAVAGDQLFFTSTAGGQSRLYQSGLRAREWTKATVPPGFPVIAEGEFGTGSLSPDGRLFFFTICSGLTGEDATNRCEIFRGERSTTGAWSQPVRLGEAINAPSTNNAFPFVTLGADGRYQLYFSSDRPGGRGGMDLYLSSEMVPNDPNGFSAPANLGPVINTVSDEITPSWLAGENMLYFSSNGHPGFGGQDVFRSQGTFGSYQRPENMGQPVNSAADDYGLSLSAGGSTGYLTSNRIFTGGKDKTTETDIFMLNFRAGRAKLKATVYDNTTGNELSGAEVTLLEMGESGGYREVDRRIFPTGVYAFDLRPGGKYRVVVEREGYQGKEYQVETSPTGSTLYGQPVFLVRSSVPNGGQGAQPRVLGDGGRQGTSSGSAPGGRPQTGSAGTTTTSAPAEVPTTGARNTATAPPDPVAYRIQISAQRKFDPSAGKYEGIRVVGDIVAEPIPNRDLQRITVGYFTDKESTRQALRKVHANGFPSAFVVRYDNGKRYGQVKL
ncbi:PD40 domain-containing protein [Neolewinella agarilytica]|nr:PD40 domain-containing protein [Neolewinella agarilytica]